MTKRFVALVALISIAQACSSAEEPSAPKRACGLTVWHKPASAEAHVEIVGDWDGWKRPGIDPDRVDGGWRVTKIDPSPGEHAFAIVEDGTWLTERNEPMTADHDGTEVSLAVVPDCSQPMLRVDSVETTVDGSATVRASFLAAASAAALDPASLDASGLRVVSADPASGAITLEVADLKRGKYIYSLKAKDTHGAAALDARATVWIDGRAGDDAWDPRDAIVYQVVIDRFRGRDGAALATPSTPAARAGGTLSGVRAALDAGEFDALGVNTLWLSPLYTNPDGEFPGNDGRMYSSYHGYWPIASRALDPRVTNEAELDAFMSAAHAKGIRVLFDVVPNHVHEQHPVAKEHPEWFDKGCICGQGSCDWEHNIKSCWFAPYLPDFDWLQGDVARAVTDDVLWWFDRWGADGVRIDAVPMMPRSATRRIATTIRDRWRHKGNEPYILGENFTGPGGFGSLRYDLGPYGLDGSFHFPLMWTLRDAIASEVAPMSKIDTDFRAGEKAWDGSGAVMGLILGNHDVSRFASVSSGTADGDTWTPPPQPLDPTVYAKQRIALVALFTLPGAPVLYYGDEVALAGRSDPDCRRVMPAEASLSETQVATRDVARRVGRARACSKDLRRGDLRTLVADDESYVFARGSVIVALVRRPPLPIDVPATGSYVDVITGAKVDGKLTVPSDPFSAHVYVPADTDCAAP